MTLGAAMPQSVEELDFGRHLRPGDGVLWAQACAEPRTLVRHLLEQRPVAGLKAFVGIPVAGTLRPEDARWMSLTSYTGSGGNSALYAAGALDILPAHYSALPRLIRRGSIRADVVLVQLSPPDADGRHSLGVACEYLTDALSTARVVIGEVHPDVPRTYGGPLLHRDDLTAVVNAHHPPVECPAPEPTPVQRAIARNVAALIEDGATLQFGVGALAEAVLAELHDRRHLGVHSGLLPDGLVPLAEGGVITGERKTIDRGLAVGGMLLGTRRLFAYADRNARVRLLPTSYTHAPAVLAAQHEFVALNSAVEVDLTGQVNAEVARGRYLGAVGGAVDFLRGAAASRGGIPVVMLPSRAGGASRIVSALSGPVSTPRSDAGVIVTEYGVADLRGLSLKRRAEAMIGLAAPEFRAELDQSADAVLAAAKGA